MLLRVEQFRTFWVFIPEWATAEQQKKKWAECNATVLHPGDANAHVHQTSSSVHKTTPAFPAHKMCPCLLNSFTDLLSTFYWRCLVFGLCANLSIRKNTAQAEKDENQTGKQILNHLFGHIWIYETRMLLHTLQTTYTWSFKSIANAVCRSIYLDINNWCLTILDSFVKSMCFCFTCFVYWHN